MIATVALVLFGIRESLAILLWVRDHLARRRMVNRIMSAIRADIAATEKQ